jgi:hypothetical protein
MTDNTDAYHELYVYAGTRGRDKFILQHVVDAGCAQAATAETKPIALVFALIGLFLHVERNVTGLRVQQVHMQLGRKKQPWPAMVLPADRGAVRPEDVMKVPAGPERDAAISDWCRSVWEPYQVNRQAIIDLLQQHRII